MDPRPSARPYTDTQLFTVRVWREEVGTPAAPQTEWRGQVCHVASGGVYYFRDWPALLLLLQRVTAEGPPAR